MGGGLDGDRLARGLDPEVHAGELGHVGDLRLDDVRVQVADVQVDVVLLVDPTPLLDLLVDGTTHHVPGGQVLDGGGVPLHEALACAVDQHPTLAPDGLRDEDPHLVDAGGMELEELHILQRDPAPVADGQTVPSQGVGVRGDLEDAAVPAGREQHRLGAEDVELAGGQLVRHDAGGPPLGDQEVQHIELVEEADPALDALLIEGLQDHVARAVSRVAGAADRRLPVVAGVAAESALIDAAVGGSIERQAPVLELYDGVDCLTAHDLRGGLVHQIVPALHGVEDVPLGVVLLHVSEGGAHPSLGRPCV